MDIEHIVDVELGINIVPIPELLASTEVDGFIGSAGSTIFVDQSVQAHLRLHRYRFTLAHEIAHVVLHKPLIDAAKFATAEEWQSFQNKIPEEDRRWYEWQAYAFAGLVLVPADQLAQALRETIEMARGRGLKAVDLNREEDRTYLSEFVGRRFEVSRDVILRRGERDGHWKG